ncbi:M15 family peptidase [Candidatus Peregrinibacteria bacterium]|nr:M15 family peptidase [Candidatus Peregrinibacteria bacterium]
MRSCSRSCHVRKNNRNQFGSRSCTSSTRKKIVFETGRKTPHFSQKSIDNLITVHPYLYTIFTNVIKVYDCSILCGHREKTAQNLAYYNGKSSFNWPNSKHNKMPSLAVDAAPYPINWQNIKEFYHLWGIVRGIAIARGFRVRWGGDWGDYCHFELL